MRGDGFLAIWSDVEKARESDYLHWLTREHAGERLGVPGFLAVRVFRSAAQADFLRVLIVYELADPAVLSSPAYLARLDAPTPWTRRIMPTLANFARGGGRRVASHGIGRGGHVAALRFDTAPACELSRAAAALVACERIAAAHHLATDADRTAIPTAEKAMRADDGRFAHLLLVEALDPAALAAALARLPAACMPGFSPAQAPSYTYMFGLERAQTARS